MLFLILIQCIHVFASSFYDTSNVLALVRTDRRLRPHRGHRRDRRRRRSVTFPHLALIGHVPSRRWDPVSLMANFALRTYRLDLSSRRRRRRHRRRRRRRWRCRHKRSRRLCCPVWMRRSRPTITAASFPSTLPRRLYKCPGIESRVVATRVPVSQGRFRPADDATSFVFDHLQSRRVCFIT